MPETIRKVNIIGHLHPDTDSICSAIALAYLKNQTGDIEYEPRRAGTLNRETIFVLKHFNFEEPQLITSVRPQIKDITIQDMHGIDPEMSLFAAWNLMSETKTDTLCITDGERDLMGLIAVKDIANANMNVFDTKIIAESKTLYSNILSTLKAHMLLGDPDEKVDAGKVVVGTTPEMMEGNIERGDTVLVTNRYETQRFAVESGAACLVVCNDARISNVVLDAAKANGCTVMTTPYDTFSAARLISMSIPVRSKMLDADKVLRFSVNTTVDDARKTITQSRHRFFPVVDEDGRYVGLVSTPNLLNVNQKHVILVDHNERSQAVDGLEQAVIMEIIDHHRIGSIETTAPALFRNEPVGCTCTILFSMYQEAGIEIPSNIAGLMLSAILSDTLAFRSPTCTKRDEYAARELARGGHRLVRRRDVRRRRRTHGPHCGGGLSPGLQGILPWLRALWRGPGQLHDRKQPQGRRGARRPIPQGGCRRRRAAHGVLYVHGCQVRDDRDALLWRTRRGRRKACVQRDAQGRHRHPARRGESQEAGHPRPHEHAAGYAGRVAKLGLGPATRFAQT